MRAQWRVEGAIMIPGKEMAIRAGLSEEVMF